MQTLFKAEHGDNESARHSVSNDDAIVACNSKSPNIDKIEPDEDSDSENGEFITIKVTNEEGKTEAEEIDHIKEHKLRYKNPFAHKLNES